jgi:AcrR family transcriptional regulator
MKNKTTKEGRKVRYTKMVLRDSLIELMRKKPITRISIKEICALADIGRTTFYAHYQDQYDLLRQIEGETLVEVHNSLHPHINVAQKSQSRETAAIIHNLLQFVANNGNSIQVLLGENGDDAFQKEFFCRGIEGISQFMSTAGIKSPDGNAARYGFVFVIGGMIAIIQEWLKNGMDTQVPELAKMLDRMLRFGGGVSG